MRGVTPFMLLGVACNDATLTGNYENLPPTITISGGSREVADGAPVEVVATFGDPDSASEDLLVRWLVDGATADGAISDSHTGQSTITWSEGWVPGAYEVRAEVTDPDGAADADTVTISVVPNEPPQVEFLSPEAEGYTTASIVPVEVIVIDDRDEPGAVALAWTLDEAAIDGPTSAGADYRAAFDLAPGLDEGDHVIALVATDKDGESATAFAGFRIGDGGDTGSPPDTGDGDTADTGEPTDTADTADTGDGVCTPLVDDDFESGTDGLLIEGIGGWECYGVSCISAYADHPVHDGVLALSTEGGSGEVGMLVPALASDSVLSLYVYDHGASSSNDNMMLLLGDVTAAPQASLSTAPGCEGYCAWDADSGQYVELAPRAIGWHLYTVHTRHDGAGGEVALAVDGLGTIVPFAGDLTLFWFNDDGTADAVDDVYAFDTTDSACVGVLELTWYADADGDGYGDIAASALSDRWPDDHVLDATDCDDADAAVNPGTGGC